MSDPEKRSDIDGGIDTESAEDGYERLVAENRDLRSRVEELETVLAEVQDELATIKGEGGTDDGTVEPPESSEATDAARRLVTSGGQPTKVIGSFSEVDGIGVHGRSKAGSGTGKGVVGTSESTDDGAAGVRGEMFQVEGIGVEGISTNLRSTEQGWNQPAGVYGETDFQDAAGVVGRNTQNNPRTYGVWGKVDNTDDTAAAVYADNAGVAGPEAAARGLEVKGYSDVSQTTLSAYLDTSQSPDSDEGVQILFDKIIRNDWPDSAFDTSRPGGGGFTVPTDGKYHVDAGIYIDTKFSAGEKATLYILKGTNAMAFSRRKVSGSTDIKPSLNVSKTLDMNSGEEIAISVNHSHGQNATLATGLASTYMTIDKIG